MDAHEREAAAATAAIADFYGEVFRPIAGDIVRVLEPFTWIRVSARVTHSHGDVVLVVTDRGETVEYDREDRRPGGTGMAGTHCAADLGRGRGFHE